MKKSVFVLTLVAAITLVLTIGPANAFSEISKESGFGGFVRLGGGISYAKSNMIAGTDFGDVGQRKINSLTANPDSESDVIPQFDFNLKYTFASVKTEIFLGVPHSGHEMNESPQGSERPGRIPRPSGAK